MRRFLERREIWWHCQNLNEHGPWWQHSRAWLHFGERQSIGVEWTLFPRTAAIKVRMSDTVIDDDALVLHVAIPFVISVFFSISHLDVVLRQPGVRWQKGDYRSGSRELGVAWHHNRLWLYPWDDANGNRTKNIHPATLLFGRGKYSCRLLESGNTIIQMPEADYPATWTLSEATWKRPRWPWPKVIRRGEIEIAEGIPIPGKGTTAYNLDDDAIYSLSTQARTSSDLIGELYASVLDSRERYGGRQDWQPRESSI